MYTPSFQITPAMTTALMEIEACRQDIDNFPITVEMLTSLRETAKLAASHYSTQIEGNQLTLAQVEQVLQEKSHFPGRQRDEKEVRDYFRALGFVEQLSSNLETLTEQHIQDIHALVMDGKKHSNPYRDGQNVIRDGHSGSIVYMPPEAKDVPGLMTDLVNWINEQLQDRELPAPLVSALAHYQFATIHPYYDGNGRTARLLTTLILHKTGYGLKGIYSLEEYYAQNLQDYYDALTVAEHHNYYFGRVDAEVTKFLDYFCTGMADAFAKVRVRASEARDHGSIDQSPQLRCLEARQRQAMTLFLRSRSITTKELAHFLKISPRSSRELCAKWVKNGFLMIDNPSKKSRSYCLSSRYEALIEGG